MTLTPPTIPDLGSAEFWQQLSEQPEMLCYLVCSVDLVNLELTLQRHASLRGWVNAAHETAKIQEDSAKWERDKAEARALINARNTLDAKGKAPPVEVIKAQAILDPEVEAAMITLRAAEGKRGALRAMSYALEDRKDMLVQLSAQRRKEKGEY